MCRDESLQKVGDRLLAELIAIFSWGIKVLGNAGRVRVKIKENV